MCALFKYSFSSDGFSIKQNIFVLFLLYVVLYALSLSSCFHFLFCSLVLIDETLCMKKKRLTSNRTTVTDLTIKYELQLKRIVLKLSLWDSLNDAVNKERKKKIYIAFRPLIKNEKKKGKKCHGWLFFRSCFFLFLFFMTSVVNMGVSRRIEKEYVVFIKWLKQRCIYTCQLISFFLFM